MEKRKSYTNFILVLSKYILHPIITNYYLEFDITTTNHKWNIQY